MGIKLYKPNTAGRRKAILFTFNEITKLIPERNLLKQMNRSSGRNNRGVITAKHRGGGHKKRYRKIDFKRNKTNINGKVAAIEYDPNRNARIALIHYLDGEKRYIIQPQFLNINDSIQSGINIPIKIGNTLSLENIPLGTNIHNIEISPKKGGQLVRAAGTSAKILARLNNHVIIRLPSKEIRLIQKNCFATIGRVSNRQSFSLNLGKAGRKRWLGRRPTVRGSVMNACDHPHGGGEGRAAIGKKKPLTPWGKLALGLKTRKKNKYSDIYILRKKQ